MPAKEVDATATARLVPRSNRTDAGAPFVVLAEGTDGGPMRIVVVASGALAPGDETWLDGADAVIAADGGATILDRLGLRPDRLVGDLDSVDVALAGRLAGAGVPVDRHPVDKEASDTELAVRTALARGADRIDLLGATGGDRLDHELANLLLLADPALAVVEIRAVVGATTIRVLRSGETLALHGAVGDVVTLLPVGGDARGVTTSGLRWPLDAATLPLGSTRGLSNVVVAAASVSLTDGVLLVVERRNSKELRP